MAYFDGKLIRKQSSSQKRYFSENINLTLVYFRTDQIISEIDSCFSVCTKVEESIKKTIFSKQNCLKKAFEGKLLNDTELDICHKKLDWKPREKLLERIKAEKKMNNKIEIYQTDDNQTRIDVIFEEGTVWLDAYHISSIFDVQRPAIVKHINNIYNSEELTISSNLFHFGTGCC